MIWVVVQKWKGATTLRRSNWDPESQTVPLKKAKSLSNWRLLRGTEALIWCPHNLSREVCCLLRGHIQDIWRRIQSMIKPEDYNSLMVFQAVSRLWLFVNLKISRKTLYPLGICWRDQEGKDAVFSSILPAGDWDLGRRRKASQSNEWLHGWCHTQGFGFYDLRHTFGKLGTLTLDGSQLTIRGKNIPRQQALWAHHQCFKLDLMGEGECTAE